MDQKLDTNLDSADIQKILEFLPHRYPFLLVDRMHSMHKDEACIGIKNVTINEPHFQGHFPEKPIMPGVLIVEGMAQTAGALVINHLGPRTNPQIVYFLTIDKARFRKPVVPGDQLEYHVKKIKSRGNIWKFNCEARVEGNRVAEAELSAMISDAD